MSNDDDAPTGRDIKTIWKTIAYVGGALGGVGIFAALLISWGFGQGETNLLQTARMEAMDRRIEAVEKRQDNLERESRFHERRGHGAPAPSPRP